MIKQQVFELKNGVRGVLVPLTGLNSVTIEVFVKIGSKYEEANAYGISHFLEHMAFKGTTKRLSANDIHKELDAKGASHNAGTGHEFTSYYIKTIQENIPWALEMLADILLNPAIPEVEVEKEKDVIIEEIRMYEDNPAMGLASDFLEMMYQNTGVGCWNIAGSVKSVSGIHRKELIDYRKKYLNPKETVVVVSGHVGDKKDVSLIKSLVEAFFGVMETNLGKLPKISMNINGTKKLTKKKQIEQAHFCLGVPSIGWNDPRKYVSRLVDVILVGNSSSRIFNKVREEKGLAYYIYGISDLFAEGGYNGVQEGVRMDKLEEAIEVTKKEYLEFDKTVTEEELARAKDYLVGKAKLNMDRTDFWSDFVGQKLLLDNKIQGLEEEIEKYKAVELSELRNYASEFFVENNFRLLSLSR